MGSSDQYYLGTHLQLLHHVDQQCETACTPGSMCQALVRLKMRVESILRPELQQQLYCPLLLRRC